MSLRRITEYEYEKYEVVKAPTLIGLVKEIDWYADDEAKLLGIILLDSIDKDWSYVVLGLEEDGQYRWTAGDVSFETKDQAEIALQNKIIETAESGKIEAELYSSTLFDSKSLIIKDIDDEVKRFFQKYPQALYDINPRKFEELIASIMKDFGFDIELTQASRDGGRDIIAKIKNSVTSYLTYVECKRYAADNKIDVGIIRQVQGVHYTHKPSKSIIVTTSFFTKDAEKEARLLEYQLDLKDFNHLKEWLARYAR